MNKIVKYVTISPQEIEAIYRCISLAMDLRDNIEWNDEKQYWSEWSYMTKHIDIALTTTHKLAGYETGVNSNMPSEELLNKMRQHYSEARQLAKEMWITMDNEGDKNDYYYFECGFVAGLNYQRYKALEKLSELDQELGLK